MENNVINYDNNEKIFLPKLPAIYSIGSCLILSIVYVASLYIWKSEHNRDHPTTVKKRFFSVSLVMLISPIFVYLLTPSKISDIYSIWELMGFRMSGLFTAFTIPLLLTVVLYLGPIIMQIRSGLWRIYTEPEYWWTSVQNILWLRNHIVAPLSEEFTFRSCMMPLLLRSFSPTHTILISPLFFGVAHFHHMIERLRSGVEIKPVLIFSTYQFLYTSIFAMYSAYLFAITGHFIAPFIAHAFCNHMGFPDIQDILNQPEPTKQILFGVYVLGVIIWLGFLPFINEPYWYVNAMYWQ